MTCRLPAVLATAVLLAACSPGNGGRPEIAMPAPQLNAPGDAGPAAGGQVPPAAAATATPASDRLVVGGSIHVLGGGVRGLGVLARYPAAGARRITVARATAPPAREPYRPDCLLRIEDPDGNAAAALPLDEGVRTVELPAGAAGIWTVSVVGGRQHDRITLDLPAAAEWGVRGEMALGVGEGVPATAWLWLPPGCRRLLVEQCGGEAGAIALRGEDGRELGRTANRPGTGSRLTVLIDPAPAGGVVAVDLARARGLALLVDGAPGLLCPSPAAARALAGGTVEAAGFRCAGPLQARIRAWMARQRPADLAVVATLPAEVPADLAQPMAEAQLFGQYGGLSGLNGTLARQITDPASPWCGSDWAAKPGEPERPRWDGGEYAGVVAPFLAQRLAAVAGTPARLNPLAGDRALARRAALAAFHHLSSMTGDRLVREGNLFSGGGSYPITHAFFVYGSLGEALPLVQDLLDDEARALWRAGAMALGDKLADNQGYQSNQWTHNLLGHLGVYRATGEKRFRERFERQLAAYLAGAYGRDAKFGQHPAGFYLEEFGCDGNYDNMNLTSVVAFLHLYRALPDADPALVQALAASVERNLGFKSLLWLTDHHGAPTSPSACNSRVPPSSLALSNPSGDHLASREFPLAAAKALMTARPAKGAFPASVFPYYVSDDEWALRLVREGLPGAPDAKDGVGQPLLPLFVEAFRRPLPAPATLPVLGGDGLWERPGIIAWKRGGTYGVVFHDVDGANPANKINQAVMGGGPTALWRAGSGMAVASTANQRRPMTATSAEEATFSCVCARDGQGRFWHSGTERTALRWLEPGRSFAIDATLRGQAGTLTWRYDLEDGGAVRMSVALAAPGLTDAWINLPLNEPEAAFTAADGAIERRIGAAAVRLQAPGLELGATLAGAGDRRVRCARVRLPSDGTPVAIRFAGL
ncbi:MAG: hypothetical protein L6R48_05760 [Planctomycetes bacterium]|nr:hypothetical protein [Planctomycetota bacterium]